MNFDDVVGSEYTENEALQAFAKTLSKKKDKAVAAKKNSGIENDWIDDENYYDGDDGRKQPAFEKSTTLDGPLVSNRDREQGYTKSNLFINLTRMYVDGAASRVIDMLTPTGSDRPFTFKATPIAATIDSLAKQKEQNTESFAESLMKRLAGNNQAIPPSSQAQPSVLPLTGQAVPPFSGTEQATPPMMPGMEQMPSEMAQAPMGAEQGMPQIPGMPPMPEMQQSPELQEDEAQKKADEAAEKAEVQIWDWLSESNWTKELRKLIEDIAKVGSGVLKGPYPYKSVSRRAQRTEAGMELVQVEEIKPASKRISYWNLFPDPSCGDNIHDGDFIFERDYITEKQLRDMLGMGYNDEEILAAIEEGPQKNTSDSRERNNDDERFELWYFHGFASSKDLAAAGCECEEGKSIPVIVTMVNDRVIKAALSVLDSGKFPYDILVWQAQEDSPWGVGISHIVRDPQRMLNASVRRMADNAGFGTQIVMKQGVIIPADGVYELTPNKMWFADGNSDIPNIQNAFMSVDIKTNQQELTNIINLASDFAERVTGMPLMMQGHQGQATETVGGMTMLQNNASSVLRRIARMFDDHIANHLDRYYEWLMMYSDNEEAKGDFQIVPLGSTSLYERDAANQALNQMWQLASNPNSGLSFERVVEEMLRANKINYDKLKLTQEEKEQMAQAAQQQQPDDPRVAANIEIAKIRTQTEMQKAQLNQDSDMKELQLKEQIASTTMQLKMDEAELQREHELAIKRMDHEMRIMQFSQDSGMALEQIKAKLATDTMKLRTQKELTAMAQNNKAVPELIKPPTEPVGQATVGESFYE